MSYMKARNWMFTSFENSVPAEELLKDKANFIVFQKEKCPTTGKEHFQGYVEFTESMRMGEVKRRFNSDKIHLERRRGTQQQAIDYCTKKETRIEEPLWLGQQKCQGKRNDIEEIYEDISDGCTLKEIITNHKGNAIRMIHCIEKSMLIHHGFNSLDSWILLNRKENKDKLDEKVIEDLEKTLLTRH